MAKPKSDAASAARSSKARHLSKRGQDNARSPSNGMADASLARGNQSRDGANIGLERLAVAALERLLVSKDTPAAALASAIRTALQLSGALERDRAPELPSDPESMSASDIDAALQNLLQRQVSSRKRQ